MTFTIKNEATVELAREVAKLAGESVTVAITRSLEQRRDALLAARGNRRKRVLWLADDCTNRLSDGTKRRDHGALLYDGATGLPA